MLCVLSQGDTQPIHLSVVSFSLMCVHADVRVCALYFGLQRVRCSQTVDTTLCTRMCMQPRQHSGSGTYCGDRRREENQQPDVCSSVYERLHANVCARVAAAEDSKRKSVWEASKDREVGEREAEARLNRASEQHERKRSGKIHTQK